MTEKNNTDMEENADQNGTLEAEAVVTLLKTVDYVNRISTETMEPYGVTSQQYNILRILRGAGKEGLPTLEIASRMLVHSPGVTRLIDKLEKKKLVTRKRSSSDRRVVRCTITGKGRDLLKKMDQPVTEMNCRIVQNLDQQDLKKMIVLLNRMRE
jgi:DNA-binding MarR family transcriptional regulator